MESNILTTPHVELKVKMLHAGIEKHQSVIDDFTRSIKTLMASEIVVNEDTVDMSQQGLNSEIIQKANNLADQLVFANEEMKQLYNLLPTITYIHETVQPGSVVVTDQETFFVSVSIERFKVEDIEVFGLSTQSPLYQTMQGKKKDDSFSYNNKTYKIIGVF